VRSTRTLLALTVAGAILRFYGLGHQGFWFDEANTALLVKFSPGKMIGLIPQTESTPPLYYCVAWVWSRIFGDGEAGLRSLSAVCGVLTIPVAWAAARELVSDRAAVLAAALTAFNPLLIWYSQEARSYELLVLFTALALLAFAYAVREPSPLAIAAWVIACALALATHYYAVVTVAPEAAWLLWEYRRERAVRVGVGLAALCGLALIPLALSQNSTGHDSWIAHAPLNLRLAQIVPQFLLGTGSPLRKPLKFVGFALVLVGLVLLVTRARGDERRGALLAGGLAITGFLLSLAFVAAGSDALITRNIVGLWLPATIALSGGLASTLGSERARGWVGTRGVLQSTGRSYSRGGASRFIGPALGGGLCAIGLTAAIGVQANYNLQRPNWRPVATELGPGPAPGADRLILVQHYRTLLPLSLYIPNLHFLRAPAAHRVSDIYVISISSPQQPLCWWGAACNLIPSQMQQRYRIRGFHTAWLRHVEQFTIMLLVSDRPRTVTPTEVARALVTTTLPNDELLFQRS